MTPRSAPATIAELYHIHPVVACGWLFADEYGVIHEIANIYRADAIFNSKIFKDDCILAFRVILEDEEYTVIVYPATPVWRRSDTPNVSVSDWNALPPCTNRGIAQHVARSSSVRWNVWDCCPEYPREAVTR